jgi:hypothetical protein
MKRALNWAVMTACCLVFSSCLFEYDNYDVPNCTLQGSVTDLEGNPLQVEAGGGVRIKLLDYGKSDVPKEQYLKVKMDGTYINTKVFSSVYDIVAEGPFVPLVQVDDEGNIVVDKTKKSVNVKGTTTVDFQVEPFFKLSWEGEPTFDNGIMTVNFRIDRGTDDPAWQLDAYGVGLFVSTTMYVGSNNYDNRISKPIDDSEIATKMIGQVSSLTTLDTYPMLPNHTYYIRVGARMNYNSFGYLYNYTTVKKIVVPAY